MSTKKPTHYAYAVSGEGERKTWTRIGAAWANKDGEGYNLLLDALPTNGRVVLRVPAKDEVAGGAQ